MRMSSGDSKAMTNQATGREGGTRMVVTDAGPLIHLDELECLELLADFSEVQVPEAVWREVEHHRPLALQNTKIPFVRCLPSASERVDALTALYTLHAGEHEALCLCLEFPGTLLLTDRSPAGGEEPCRGSAWNTWFARARYSPPPIEQGACPGVVAPDTRTFHLAHSPNAAGGNYPASRRDAGATIKQTSR